MQRRVVMTVRLSKAEHVGLAELARREDRSMGSVLRRLLRQSLRQAGLLEPEKAEPQAEEVRQ